MDSRVKLAAAVFFMALALFAVAGVLLYKYYKVADYVCYYGSTLPGSFEDFNSPTGKPLPNSLFINGSWVKFDDLHCYRNSGEDFVCPSSYSGGQKYLGDQYATKGAIEFFVDKA